MNNLPQYCCAIIYQQPEVIIMEQRPVDAVHAAGRLCCFGGAREQNEDPLQCIHRELQEELTWSAPEYELVHTLNRGKECIAWFYRCELDIEVTQLRCEDGYSLVKVKLQERDQHPISDWHSRVLNNYLSNINHTDLLNPA